ncbi:hypothetical protein Skr01_42140 [Sphaerisporangium krabiense]|uniref:non-specific serine/threonine protein kinase n=1 Tax=Sphaerisporangium krabiense TaxID=763782 RepID=A0A7W9DNF1_9ACTN|nr:serine/threonine-protein kinase [Sphaerisporangium krabiense]MBB5625356.1 putative Ser/Thr protein kinase [Sphaerisporangium krabiense]GII64129.1 hypothetical protein Skr01_42140 [Sphaerisporangium krabiense]
MQPARPSQSTLAISILWALAPLFTCGLATPFTIGYAAYRRRAPMLAVAAMFYFLGLFLMVLVIVAFDSSPEYPGWAAVIVVGGLFTNWIGGVIHSLAIRSMVFAPRTAVHFAAPPAYRPSGYTPAPYPGTPVPPTTPLPPVPSPYGLRPPAAPPVPGSRLRHHPPQPPYPVPPAVATNPPVRDHVTTPADAVRRTPSPLHVSTPPAQAVGPLPAGEPDHIGRYRLVGSLGQGGQGSVYLGETPEGSRVAIKVLHARLAAEAGARQRFLREVEAARRVAPFSTARVIDAGVAGERPFIVSEYVEGSSLEQLVREQGPRGHDGLVRLALGTSGALAAIHKAGIVHRDFKPSNVLIGADGPRVVDFGIARVLDNATATSSGVLGTPAYMSPEQVAGERVGPESDVFSWAATMVFAATGRPAFGEDNIAAVLNRIFTVQPDLSALPDSLAKVVGTCLDKRPENRPSASDVMLAIVH